MGANSKNAPIQAACGVGVVLTVMIVTGKGETKLPKREIRHKYYEVQSFISHIQGNVAQRLRSIVPLCSERPISTKVQESLYSTKVRLRFKERKKINHKWTNRQNHTTAVLAGSFSIPNDFWKIRCTNLRSIVRQPQWVLGYHPYCARCEQRPESDGNSTQCSQLQTSTKERCIINFTYFIQKGCPSMMGLLQRKGGCVTCFKFKQHVL